MKKILFIILWTLVLAKYADAQEQLSVRQQADKLFERYDYFKSLNLYLKLVSTKTNVQVLEAIAACYRNLNRYEDAETWYARAVADPKAAKVSHYYYAEILLRDKKFETAKSQYKIYFTSDAPTLKLKLGVCDSAAAWIKLKSAFTIKNEEAMNTEFSDWGLNYEGKTAIVFTSDRKTGNQNVDDRTGNNWFKLYEQPTGETAVNELAVGANNSTIFNDEYHVGPIAFNSTADTAYITITTAISPKKIKLDAVDSKTNQRLYTRRLQLVMASKKDGQWKVFSGFPYNNVQKYSVGNAALSKDGKVIYFTSDMPGSVGRTDIWYCEKNNKGAWGSPVNCGKVLNTSVEDDFPTIGGDGALYFSSKGFTGMGGYDIYKAKGEKANWGTPVNLKYPLNSTSDDFYLVTNDGVNGYFSSNREDGKGSDDIYSFNYKPIDSIPAKTTPTLAKTGAPGTAGTPGTVGTGTAEAPGSPNQQMEKMIMQMTLKPIYYDLDKSDIRADAVVSLQKMIALLKRYPGLKLEISSYTDSRASEHYNIELSERRSNSTVAYLLHNGIDQSRLLAKYFGESNLVNQCSDGVPCSEAEHQLNRRTEFKFASW